MNVQSVSQGNLSSENSNDVKYIIISYENAENPDQNIEYIQEFQDNDASFKNQCTSEGFIRKYEQIEEDPKEETTEYVQCIICDESFSSKWLLVEHIRNHPKIFMFLHDCILCNKKFRYLPSLQNHLRKHTGEKPVEKPYYCILCSKQFATPEYLIKHTQKHEEYTCSLTCQFCDITFKQYEHLQGHILSHVSSEPFQCTHCPKMFILPEYLKKHLQRHKNEKIFHCNICNLSFHNFLSLKTHKKTHLSLYVKPFQCYTCNSTFKRPKELKAHLMAKDCQNRVNHTNGGNFQHTNKHQEIKIEPKTEPIEINEIEKPLREEFKVEYLYDEQGNNTYLQDNGNTNSMLEDPLALDYTSVNNNAQLQPNPELLTYSTDYQLQLYGSTGDQQILSNFPSTTTSIHNVQQPTENRLPNKSEKRSAFQPTILNVTIIKPEDTQSINNTTDTCKIDDGEEINTDNIIITDGAYLYPCIFCSKIFDQVSILKQHEQTHTGDKPYQCIICNTKYTNHANLKIHEKCHQYLNYYQCYMCDRKFVDPKLLKIHFETHKINADPLKMYGANDNHEHQTKLGMANKNNLKNRVERITPMKHLTIDKNFQCAFMQFLNSNSKRK